MLYHMKSNHIGRRVLVREVAKLILIGISHGRPPAKPYIEKLLFKTYL